MKNFNQTQFFKELNLENLPEPKKAQLWNKFTELVSLEVLDKILDDLPDKQQEELFQNLAKHPQKVDTFLRKNPKVRKITQRAILKIQKQLEKSLKSK